MSAWREIGLVFTRQLGVVTREPLWSVIGLLQPLSHLLLSGPPLRALAGCGAFSAEAFQDIQSGMDMRSGRFSARAFVSALPNAVAGIEGRYLLTARACRGMERRL